MDLQRRRILSAFGIGVTAGCLDVRPPTASSQVADIELVALDAREWPQPTISRCLYSPQEAKALELEYYEQPGEIHPVQSARTLLKLCQCVKTEDTSVMREAARRYAELLVQSGTADEAGNLFFPYEFKFPVHGNEDEMLTDPWYSAMAQGIALSAFARLYHYTHTEWYLDIADQLYGSLAKVVSTPSSKDLWVTVEDDVGRIWLEEYPLEPPAHTLNGKIFSIYGLYEYWCVTQNSSVAAFTRDAIRTVAETFSEFRVPGDVSYYCLKHEIQSEKYHGVHIEQLRALAEITTGGQFRDMAETLESDFTPET